MSGHDLVERLRASVKACRAIDRAALLNEAADEIAKIRREVADMRDTPAKHTTPGECSTPRECMGRPTLTDAEREAVEIAARRYHGARPYHIKATLRGLLERMK